MGGCPLQRLNGRARFGEDWPCQLPIIGGPDLFPAQWWRELLLSPCADRGVVAERGGFLRPGGKSPDGGLQGPGLRIISGVGCKGCPPLEYANQRRHYAGRTGGFKRRLF